MCKSVAESINIDSRSVLIDSVRIAQCHYLVCPYI